MKKIIFVLMMVLPTLGFADVENDQALKVVVPSSATVDDDFNLQLYLDVDAYDSDDEVVFAQWTVAYDSTVIDIDGTLENAITMASLLTNANWEISNTRVYNYNDLYPTYTWPAGTNKAFLIQGSTCCTESLDPTSFTLAYTIAMTAVGTGTNSKVTIWPDVISATHQTTWDLDDVCTSGCAGTLNLTNDTITVYNLMKAGAARTQWSVIKELYK